MNKGVLLAVALAASGCAHAAPASESDDVVLDLGPAPDAHPASPAVERAEALIAADQPGEAAALLTQTVAASPDDARAWFTLGVARSLVEQTGPAETALRRALTLDDEYAEAWNELGLLLRASGRLEDGIASLQRAVMVRADFHDAYYNLALALEDAERFEEARGAYARAVAGAIGNDPIVRYNRAGLLMRLGDREGARAELLRARGLARGRAEVLRPVGRALLGLGESEAAADVLAEAVDAAPEPAAGLLLDAAGAARAATRRDRALAFSRRATSVAPDEPRAHAMLAITAAEAGELPLARESLARARALDAGGALRADLDRIEAQLSRTP